MRYYSTLLVLFVMIFIGCATTAPLPSTLNIVPPLPDVPAEIAAFSGIWDGKWNGWNDTILVVENIDTEKAEVILSFSQSANLSSSYYYATAKVLPGPAIEWTVSTGYRFVFEMDRGLNKIKGVQEEISTGSRQWCYLTRREINGGMR
jgi:hypothetical protein